MTLLAKSVVLTLPLSSWKFSQWRPSHRTVVAFSTRHATRLTRMRLTNRECIFAGIAILSIATNQLTLVDNFCDTLSNANHNNGHPASSSLLRTLDKNEGTTFRAKRTLMETVAPAFFPLDEQGYASLTRLTRLWSLASSPFARSPTCRSLSHTSIHH